jgi:predicted HD phosphohydrolase
LHLSGRRTGMLHSVAGTSASLASRSGCTTDLVAAASDRL